jgi:hypothetical protein
MSVRTCACPWVRRRHVTVPNIRVVFSEGGSP